MTPKVGALLYIVAQGTTVPGGGSAAAITFRWPRAVFATGFQLTPRDGDPATLARLSIAVVDEVQDQLIGNWRGESSVPLLSLQGRNGIGGPGPLFSLGGLLGFFPLQRPILDGDQWRITLSASAGADIVVAGLALRFQEGLRRAG